MQITFHTATEATVDGGGWMVAELGDGVRGEFLQGGLLVVSLECI